MIISFEGADGSGKSTLLSEIRLELETRGYHVKAMKPLSGLSTFSNNLSEIARSYREYDSVHSINDRVAIIIAFETYQISKLLELEKEKYDFILLDRWAISQKIYARVWQNSDKFAEYILDQCLVPDITFIIDTDIDEIEKRLKKRINIKPNENIFALKRVIRAYKRYANEYNNIILIQNKDGEFLQALEKILNEIKRVHK